MEAEKVQETVRNLLKDKNYLGAYVYLKSAGLNVAEEGIVAGMLVQSLAEAQEGARKRDEVEQLAFLRSLMAYCLRDWPGLQALYREQGRGNRTKLVPQEIDDFIKGIGDTVTGKTTVDAKVKEGMEEIKQRAEHAGIPVDDMVKTVEHGIKAGVQGLSNLFGEFADMVEKASKAQANDAEKAKSESPEANDTANPKAEAMDGESIKVTIENAKDPLPDDIQDAGKSKKSKHTDA